MHRHWPIFVLFALASVWLVPPATAAAGQKGQNDRFTVEQSDLAYPDGPARDYTPRLVRQRLNNCSFASAEMLIDKWTLGRRSAPQQALRRATGILTEDGGPTLRELRRAVAKVAGIDVRWSPHGGDPLTWPELLDRLANGGGALVNVWPAKLPRHYRRWIPTLTSGHSVYVERHNPAKKRLWLMDPLGRGRGFQGEWIDAELLHRAMWHSGAYVWAAATPAREPEPRAPSIADFELGAPEVDATGFSDGTLVLTIAYSARYTNAVLPPVRVEARWQRVSQPEPEPEPEAQPEPGDLSEAADHPDARPADRSALAPRIPSGLEPIDGLAQPALRISEAPIEVALPFDALSEPLTVDGQRLRATLVTPTSPGEYVLTLALRDAAGQATAGYPAEFEPIAVQIRRPLAGSLSADIAPPADIWPGDSLPLLVSATNLGSAAWGNGAAPVALAVGPVGAEPTVLVPLEAASGQTVAIPLTVYIDWPVGRTTLRVALVDGTGAQVSDAPALEFPLHIGTAGPGEIR